MSFSQANHCSNNSTISNSPSPSPSPSHSSSSSSPTSTASNSSSISSSPNTRSPWAHHPAATSELESHHHLLGSLYREEGHVYSLAAAGDFLYTGSESKNVRVWRKDFQDFSEFRSKSGMVKAIVVVNGKVFTGHQDGKIRVWAFFDDKRGGYDQVGVLPKATHSLLKSLSPTNYVRERRNRSAPGIKHYDTVSCMSVDEDHGLLYSGSWDKTLKIWRISDSKCLESVPAHDDAVNSVVATADGMVFTGSADGTVKAWRREFVGNRTEHSLVDVLLKQEYAVTAVAAEAEGAVYAGSSDGLVRFWEVGKEKEKEKRSVVYGGVLRGHKMAVLCLVVAGNLVVSGSADKSICVWRRGGGEVHECVAVLTGHGGPVKCLAAEEDGHRRWTVYSGSLDKSVKIWRVFE